MGFTGREARSEAPDLCVVREALGATIGESKNGARDDGGTSERKSWRGPGGVHMTSGNGSKWEKRVSEVVGLGLNGVLAFDVIPVTNVVGIQKEVQLEKLSSAK